MTGVPNGHLKVPYFPWSLDMLIYAARNRSACTWTHNGYLFRGTLIGCPKAVLTHPDQDKGRLLIRMQNEKLQRVPIRELENVTVSWPYLDFKWDALVAEFQGKVLSG